MNPAEFSIKNRLITVIIIIASLVAGWQAYENMPRFEDPEFTIRTAVIITQYPGATPEEVANEVTEVLETAVQQMQEVDEVTSTSSAGLSRINVDIKYNFSKSKSDLGLIWTKLRNKVADAQMRLPPGATQSFVNDDFGDVYGLYFLLTGEGFSYAELNEYAKSLRTELLSVENVAKVAIGGVQDEAIFVEISRERAATLGVSVDQVYADLSKQNSVKFAGDVQVGNRRVLLQPTGSVDSVEALGNVIVSTTSEGTIIYLRDIANVERGYKDTTKLVRYNGQPALAIGVSNVLGANVAKMGEGIDAKILETEARRPLGMELHESYHQGKIVTAAVSNFAVNVLAALGIVLVTLLIFMGMRSAVIIGAVLVITIGATLATMSLMGIPMHRISLGALIIALGMLVDNAIVVTEGILVGTQRGRKKLEIAKEIVSRTKWPLLGGTLVGIIAFAPIGFAPGETAEFTGHLFWVVMISLLYSWIFAITVVPFLADLLFKENTSSESAQKGDNKFTQIYKNLLARVLNFRWLAITAVIGLFALSIFGLTKVKPGFFPASTTPQIVVDYWLPQGTDISQTEADMLRIENELNKFEEVEGIQTLIGAGTIRFMLVYGGEPENSSYGQIILRVKDYDQIAGLMPKIQNYLDANYPDAQAKVWQFQLGPGGGSKIEVEFAGADPDVLRDLASQAKGIMAADGGAISIKDDWRQKVSVIQPIYSETKGRRLGISREDLSNALLTNFSGRSVGVYRENDNLIPIIARAPASERLNVESIASIQIPSSVTGLSVPLVETISGFNTDWDNANLLRKNRVWTIQAQTDPLPGELASDLLSRIRPDIEAIELPPGYKLKWNGELGNSADANSDLASTLPLGFLAMLMVVIILFNALRQPFVIWLIVPLALIGVVLGLLLTNTALEFMAILGLLSLVGLLIKNAIVLVDQMDLEIEEGKPRFDAVIDSAASRVRPVMMGSVTTVLGVIPLFGDAFFKSMAVVLVFGLSFATILTLLILPAIYAAVFKIKSSERA